MRNFIPHCYKIECLSNLHVGSGDNNYGVIDKQVQRDSISKIPVIHASGLKGALREYFGEYVNLDPNKVAYIFGSSKRNINEDTGKENATMQQGAFRFMEARLLSIPVRGIDSRPFYKATSVSLINGFNRFAEGIGASFSITQPQSTGEQAQTEFGVLSIATNVAEIGNEVVLMSEDVQLDVLDHLPVIARNSLDNGQSENLWYEELVPRESVFYFFVLAPDEKESGVDFEKDFNAALHNKFVQIGANATVGYGCCKLSKLF